MAPSGSRSDPGHTSSTPGCPTITQHPQGRSTGADHSHEPGWVRCPTRLTRPTSGAFGAQPWLLWRARSCLPVGGIEPWCRRPHGTPTTPFRLLGEPLHGSLDCHHQLPPGVPATIWQGCPGTLQIRQHPGLEDPMRHRILRVFGQGPAFQVCFASAATRADTHTSRRCGVSPEMPQTPIHTIRSAVRRSKQPFLPIPSSR